MRGLKINIHSEPVEDILGKTPHWIMRGGSASIFMVLILFISISAFIKYPTIISGSLRLTTRHLPVKLVSKVPGRMENICFKEGGTVNQGDKLAVIENPLSSEGIDFLQALVKTTHEFLQDKELGIEFLETSLPFGYLQPEYNIISKKIVDYNFFRRNQYYTSKINALRGQINYSDNLRKIAQTQLSLNNLELKNHKEKYDVDKELFETHVLSKLDYLASENQFIKQQQESENLKTRIEELKITSLEFKRQLEDLNFELAQKELEFTESIKQTLKIIESSVLNWRKNYVIEAPMAGEAFIINNLSEKQHVKENVPLILVVPKERKYICLIDVPVHGYGRVKLGQRVRVKLDNFPFHEFGQLSGKVIDIPKIPIENEPNAINKINYRVQVEIDQKGKTNYNQILTFNPEMTGVGEIITEEQTLLQRVFYKLRGSIEN